MSNKLSHFHEVDPKTFNALENILRAGRLHHATIIAGQDHKTAMDLARSLAQSLVCRRRTGLDACGECETCIPYAHNALPAALTLVPNDKGVITIDRIRELRQRLALRSSDGVAKVVIIDPAERMNGAAQNALLKTLEEPEGETYFLLVTALARRLRVTVRSRCQRLQLRPRPRSQNAAILEKRGVSAALAPTLAALVGTDAERALAWEEIDARRVLDALRDVDELGIDAAMDLARDFGVDRERMELLLGFLEARVRDALAMRFGARPEQLIDCNATSAGGDLVERVGRLQAIRRVKHRSPNRTLALEHALLVAPPTP